MSSNFGAKARDFMQCLKNIHRFADGQASLLHWDDEHLDELTILLAPNSGPYEGGRFEFKIKLKDDYPTKPPIVRCLTNIYHPNINMQIQNEKERNICFSLFYGEWSKGQFGLEDVINGLLFLLNYPNFDDPWSELFDPELSDKALLRNIRRSLAGMSFYDIQFPKFVEYDAAKYDYDDAEEEEYYKVFLEENGEEYPKWIEPEEEEKDKIIEEKQVLCIEETVNKVGDIIKKLEPAEEPSQTNDVEKSEAPITEDTAETEQNTQQHQVPSPDVALQNEAEENPAATNTTAAPVSLSRSDTQPISDTHHDTFPMRKSLSLNPTRSGSKRCMDLTKLYTISAGRSLTGVAMSRQDTLTCLSVQKSVRGDKRSISEVSDTASPEPKRQPVNGE